MIFFCPHSFWTKKDIFWGKYFKKLVKYCKFADRQQNKLILIFGYVVLIKLYSISKCLQIKITQKFFLLCGPILPPLIGRTIKKEPFFSSFPKLNCFQINLFSMEPTVYDVLRVRLKISFQAIKACGQRLTDSFVSTCKSKMSLNQKVIYIICAKQNSMNIISILFLLNLILFDLIYPKEK